VVDLVISSYTPTIRALAYARRTLPEGNGRRTASKADRIVVVAMPHTPGASDLPCADAETDLLRQRFGERVFTLVGSAATHDAVVATLPDARWAHFACHGFNPADPSASYLLLTDHRKRPLTVVDVARLRLDEADLAFLSACSTARPSSRLTDEAIHLASAFQLAGYRHVIGTLWRINDQNALELADGLYADVATAGTVDSAAAALHAVTSRLRDQRAQTPSVWASYIHSGA
jgi:CHAT domain-containing protein